MKDIRASAKSGLIVFRFGDVSAGWSRGDSGERSSVLGNSPTPNDRANVR